MFSVDAERIIKAGGLFINHQRVTEPEYVLIRGEHVLHNNITFVRVGEFRCTFAAFSI